MLKTLKDKFNVDFYCIFILTLILLLWGASLYTNAYLFGMPVETMSNLIDARAADHVNESLNSANLPSIYVFHFLYKYLGLSDEFVKISMILLVAAVEIVAIYKIAILAFDNKISAILAVIILLFSSLFYSVGAPKPFIENNLAALAIVLTVLATLFWLRENHKLSALIIGFSFDCHPIYPLAFILTFFSYLIIRYKTISARTVIASLAVFLLVTLPVTLSVAKSAIFVVQGVATESLDPELIWRYIRLAQPEHAFFGIKPEFHLGFSIYIASFLLLSLFLIQGERAKQKIFLKLFLLIFVTISFNLFDDLNSYYFKIIPLFNLKLARFTSYGSTMVYIILAGAVTYTINSSRVNKILQILLFSLLCFSVFNPCMRPYTSLWINHLLILEVVIIYYLYNLYHARENLAFKIVAFNAALLAVTLVYFYYLVLFNENTHNMAFGDFFTLKKAGDFFITLFNVHFKLDINDTLIGRMFQHRSWVADEISYISLMKVIVLFTFLLICYTGIAPSLNLSGRLFKDGYGLWYSPVQRLKQFYLMDLYNRFICGREKIIVFNTVLIILSVVGFNRQYRIEDFRQTPLYQYETPMKEWVKDHTPKEARFLVPPYLNSWFDTSRYTFYDANIINSASYNKAFIMDAIKRFQVFMDIDLKGMTEKEMNEISPLNENWGKRYEFLNKRYDNLSEERILEFRDNYNIDYFVTASEKKYTFPVVYQNKKFSIYKLNHNNPINKKA